MSMEQRTDDEENNETTKLVLLSVVGKLESHPGFMSHRNEPLPALCKLKELSFSPYAPANIRKYMPDLVSGKVTFHQYLRMANLKLLKY
jgi:hypothetical protein